MSSLAACTYRHSALWRGVMSTFEKSHRPDILYAIRAAVPTAAPIAGPRPAMAEPRAAVESDSTSPAGAQHGALWLLRPGLLGLPATAGCLAAAPCN